MKDKTIASAFNQIAVGPGEKFLVGGDGRYKTCETYEKVPLQNGYLLVHYHFNNISPRDSGVSATIFDGNKLTVLEPKNMAEIDRDLITGAYAMGGNLIIPLKEFLDPKPR